MRYLPYILCCRKKGVLLLYKVFLRYPEALRPAFPRLKEKLEDPDPGVQVTAILIVDLVLAKAAKTRKLSYERFSFRTSSVVEHWNCNDLLRFRFLLWKSFGSGTGSGSSSGSRLISTVFQQQKICKKPFLFTCILELQAAMFPRKLASNF
jgi:hypothetical protein